MGSWFPGFVAGFWLEGRLYRFASYTHARITRFELREKGCYLELTSQKYCLQVEVVGEESGERLRSPRGGRMSESIRESLSAQAQVTLIDSVDQRVLFSGRGHHGGFEREGDLTALAHELVPKKSV